MSILYATIYVDVDVIIKLLCYYLYNYPIEEHYNERKTQRKELTMEEIKVNYKILAPRIPKDLDEFQQLNNTIKDHDYFSDAMIFDCSSENQRAEHVSLNGMIFRNVTFTAAAFEFLDLIDVRFENCDLSNANLSSSIFHRVEMINCKLLGINLSESTLQNVSFDNCNCRYSSFRFLRCKQVNFKNCLLQNADFEESHFDKVAFSNCNLEGAEMAGTKLKDIDFRDSEIEGIGVRIEDLYGAIVSPMQAVSLSRLLGIIVK